MRGWVALLWASLKNPGKDVFRGGLVKKEAFDCLSAHDTKG